jgi:hypothetical protein
MHLGGTNKGWHCRCDVVVVKATNMQLVLTESSSRGILLSPPAHSRMSAPRSSTTALNDPRTGLVIGTSPSLLSMHGIHSREAVINSCTSFGEILLYIYDGGYRSLTRRYGIRMKDLEGSANLNK